MSGSEFVPPPDEQAEEIIAELRALEGFDLAADIAPADIVDNIDPDKPTSVNLRRVREALELSTDETEG